MDIEPRFFKYQNSAFRTFQVTVLDRTPLEIICCYFVNASDKAETFAQVQASCPGFRWEVGGLYNSNGKRC